LFKAPDKIDNIAARDWSAGRRAEVCAASERPIVVDQTIAGHRLEHGTGAIGIFRQRLPASGSKRASSDDCFPFCEIGSSAGQFEMAAFGLARAAPFNRPLLKIDIDLSDLRKRAFFEK
jgi:hypothetical protein